MRGALAAMLVVGLLPCRAHADDAAADGVEVAPIAEPHADGEVIVVYDPADVESRSFSLDDKQGIESLGYEVTEDIGESSDGAQAVVASVPEGKGVEDAIAELEDAPGVAYAQPNYEYALIDEVSAPKEGAVPNEVDDGADAFAETNDPARQNQWYLRGSNVVQAWDYVRSDGTVTVAVLDTGCRLDHEDLSGSIDAAHAYDTFEDVPLAASPVTKGDEVGHGTHVCGILGAQANNGVGIAGVSYNATVLPIKVFSNEAVNPKARTSDIVQAYDYLRKLVDNGAVSNLRVVNMSLGYYSSGASGNDRQLEQSIKELRGRGVLTVCAGGNGDAYGNPRTDRSIPADLDVCVSVTSLDRDGGNSYWSDYNRYKDISAPGESIFSTLNYSVTAYGMKSGTSMAAPIVTGAACLLWAADTSLTVDEAEAALLDNAEPIDDPQNDRRSVSGSKGALDVEASVRAVLGKAPVDPEPVEPVKPDPVPLASCAVNAIADQVYTGSAVKPRPVVTYAGATLKEGVDYVLRYENNVKVGTATVVLEGRGSYSGVKTVRFAIVEPTPAKAVVKRLAGETALGTMAAISARGFADGSCSSVVVATLDGYWDALTASALAGRKSCPVLITDGKKLSPETAAEIKRLGARTVYVAGGPAAVSDGVKASISKVSGVSSVLRVAGDTAIGTSLKIYEAGKGSWGSTAIVATSETFQDALSASPYAYAKAAPVFLANASTHQLDDRTLKAIRGGGFTRVLIAGGAAAISSNVERQLKGIACVRKGGATAYETSSAIATWCLSQGMRADKVGIATGEAYYDALTGSALCGKNNAALVLVADEYRSAITSFVKPNKTAISYAFVFGGTAAVSKGTENAIRSELS